jgi:hypothetical protein
MRVKKGTLLAAAVEAYGHDCGPDVMGCIMELAIRKGDFEAAHEIGVRFESLISDELVRELQTAILSSLARVQKAEELIEKRRARRKK